MTALPADHRACDNTVESTRAVIAALDREETMALLQEVPTAYRCHINDVLLTALAEAFREWTGEPTLLVDLERHGREEFAEGMDISRTVGWFTSITPVLLDLSAITEPAEALKAVKDQMRGLPESDLNYGLLRYLCSDDEVRKQLAALPQAEVSFNYFGRFDQAMENASAFRVASESVGPTRSLKGKRPYLLEINGSVSDGRLRMKWSYSENFHLRSTVEGLSNSFIGGLQRLIANRKAYQQSNLTPSDFPLLKLDQRQLDRLLTRIDAAKGNS